MLSNYKFRFYHWLFIGIFAATPFFLPAEQVELVPVNPDNKEIAGVSVGVGVGGGGRYYHGPRRYRYYPRGDHYYYRHGYPYYYDDYYGPYYRDRYYHHRYPRAGGGVYFQVK